MCSAIAAVARSATARASRPWFARKGGGPRPGSDSAPMSSRFTACVSTIARYRPLRPPGRSANAVPPTASSEAATAAVSQNSAPSPRRPRGCARTVTVVPSSKRSTVAPSASAPASRRCAAVWRARFASSMTQRGAVGRASGPASMSAASGAPRASRRSPTRGCSAGIGLATSSSAPRSVRQVASIHGVAASAQTSGASRIEPTATRIAAMARSLRRRAEGGLRRAAVSAAAAGKSSVAAAPARGGGDDMRRSGQRAAQRG